MSRLVDALYPAPDLRRTPISTLLWWESRRLTYNKAVGSAGLVTLTGCSLLLLVVGEGIVWHELLAGVVVYGVLANVCYTGGWLVELFARRVWGREAPYMGPWLFREGLIFSVGLTLFPLLVLTFITALHLVLRIV
jgi:hypothetical protein